MAKTANLYARIDPEVKEKAESILQVLGLSASNAINMFYMQIILQNGIPFDVKIPNTQPEAEKIPETKELSSFDVNKMSAKEIDQILKRVISTAN
ncbi:MAG: type II toxin-antitoxin system RelB/DinJ family antitoxin [Clostridiales bacterium]|nr:type II toxin-antitoxin system RelB/DinJ family antitoxin [Clostridiales bacterium]